MFSNKTKLQVLFFLLALLGVAIGLITSAGLVIFHPKNAGLINFLLPWLMIILNIIVVVVIIRNKKTSISISIWAGIGIIQAGLIFFFFYKYRTYLFPQTLLLLVAALLALLDDLLHEQDTKNRLFGSHFTTLTVDLRAELTQRERQILHFVAKGYSNQEIALELVISQNTVRHHVHAILSKLGCSSRSKAAALAIKAGITTGEFEQ